MATLRQAPFDQAAGVTQGRQGESVPSERTGVSGYRSNGVKTVLSRRSQKFKSQDAAPGFGSFPASPRPRARYVEAGRRALAKTNLRVIHFFPTPGARALWQMQTASQAKRDRSSHSVLPQGFV